MSYFMESKPKQSTVGDVGILRKLVSLIFRDGRPSIEVDTIIKASFDPSSPERG